MSATYTTPASDGVSHISLSTRQNSSSYCRTVPSELLRRIVCFLHPSDALILTSSDILEKRVNVSALQPMSLPSMRADDRYFNGDIPQPYEPRIHFPCDVSNIHSITVRAQWKDQGWGNQKGGLFIIATPKTLNVEKNGNSEGAEDASLDDLFEGGRVVVATSACASHEWEQVELTFYPKDSEYYCIWYRVGGGGNHALFMKDVEVITFVFDDHKSTYMKTYECLYNVGCLNSKSGRAPIRSNGEQRWTQIERHQASQPIYNVKRPTNMSDLFYPTLLLSVCRSIQRLKESAEDIADSTSSVASADCILFPALQFLSDYGIPIDKQSLSAIDDIIQTDINEGDTDWKIYEENCRKLRQRLDWNDESNSTAADDRNMHRGRGIPIDLRNATVNGFRMVFPIAGQRQRGADGNNDDEQNNNGGGNDAAGNGIHIEPILPPNADNNPMENNAAAMPQVINNPDGTFTINLGNLDDLAEGAVPEGVADMHNHHRGMDVDALDENNPENEEMFGIARAAMAAVFGFRTDNEDNVGNNNNNNNNNENMNGEFPMAGFQNFLQQVHGGQGGAVGGGVFVGGGNINGNMHFGGGNNGGFPFQNIIDLAMNANNVAQQPRPDPTVPVNDHVMTDVDDDDDDHDDDAEEVPIM